MNTYIFKVTGRVQGVFFRACTQEKATALGLTGFARNEPDGSVLVAAQGSEKALDELEAWLWIGSPKSEVSSVTKEVVEREALKDFAVL